jgi:hypothetical protein
MNKSLLPAATLAVALSAACEAPAPSNNSNQTAATNAATPAATPSTPDLAEQDRRAYEAIKRKDWDAFAAMLADEQLYVTSDGVYDKAAAVEGLKKLDIKEYTLSDFKTVNAAPDVVIVTFTARGSATYDGKAMPDAASRETTAWVKRGDKWLSAFHQDTTIEPPPPTPTPVATATATPAATATASATPASTPATAPDATGMEKLIWEALKRKDWDAFAAMLAEDQLEVWSAGVFNKAASVEGVKAVNFAGTTASDFREVKLGPTATLVTYVVRGPQPDFGPDGERHSSIWVNRGGRWLAVFHQATRIKK